MVPNGRQDHSVHPLPRSPTTLLAEVWRRRAQLNQEAVLFDNGETMQTLSFVPGQGEPTWSQLCSIVRDWPGSTQCIGKASRAALGEGGALLGSASLVDVACSRVNRERFSIEINRSNQSLLLGKSTDSTGAIIFINQ